MARGQHLVRADRGFATGGGLIGRLIAPLFARVLDQLHRRLRCGGFEVTLPDGARRAIGFHRSGPVATVHIHHWMALVRLAKSGSLGWYKAWVNGECSSPDLVALFELFSLNAVALGDAARAKGPFRWVNSLAHAARDNKMTKARANIAAHYDLGNDFYAAWLDGTMTYSSARFTTPLPLAGGVGGGPVVEPAAELCGIPTLKPSRKREGDLERAQNRKIELLLDRLALKPGDRLLEIGCGWGSLAIAAATRGAKVVGLTLSKEQKAWADARIAEAGLADRIDIRLQDYRDTHGSFDAIASVEMVEAVGMRWWGAYLDAIARNLKPGGRAALQFISINHALFDRYSRNPDFIQTYIFPGGMLLDEPRFAALAVERGLSWQDRDSFAGDYAETLRQWRARFDAAVARGELAGFEPAFHQLWRYYLMYCEGGFRGGAIDVAQTTLVKG